MAKSKKQNKEIQISKSSNLQIPCCHVNVGSTGSTNTSNTSASAKKKKKAGPAEEAYFRISVRDNGCGMSHDAILNLLGRVLSGSK
jgi:hypothetical protein